MKRKQSFIRGFTSIELLVVIDRSTAKVQQSKAKLINLMVESGQAAFL
jgi:hypothetical protein